MAFLEVEFSGLDELKRALLELPAELTADAGAIVKAHANAAAARIIAAYPTGPTGNLKAGVEVEHLDETYTARSIVRSTAPHAYMYEMGTEVRHYKGIDLGRMTPRPTFIPIAQAARRDMYRALIAVVQAAGFQVSGADVWGESIGEIAA